MHPSAGYYSEPDKSQQMDAYELICSLVAKLPQHSLLAVREFCAAIRCCKRRMLRTRQWTGVCKTLMPDVMAPEAHQNDQSYVCELTVDLLLIHYGMVGGYLEDAVYLKL